VLRRTLRKICLMLLALTTATSVIQFAAAQVDTPAPQRQAELMRLLRHDCGSCHGLRLTGGLGPALRPEALLDKSTVSLTQVILQGRPGTPMPGWAPFMSENEAQWLAESLVNGVPDED